jgi:hypothetical protein
MNIWKNCQPGFSAGLLCVALIAPPPVNSATFTAASIPNDAQFRIASAHSGQCWDVPGGQYVVGTLIQQYPCHTGPNQTWTFRFATTGNRYHARITSAGNSQLCAARTSANRLVLDLCATPQAGNSVSWFVNLRTSGFYAAAISGVNFAGCVDVPASAQNNQGLANAVPLQIYDCHGNYNQSWLLLPSR